MRKKQKQKRGKTYNRKKQKIDKNRYLTETEEET